MGQQHSPSPVSEQTRGTGATGDDDPRLIDWARRHCPRLLAPGVGTYAPMFSLGTEPECGEIAAVRARVNRDLRGCLRSPSVSSGGSAKPRAHSTMNFSRIRRGLRVGERRIEYYIARYHYNLRKRACSCTRTANNIEHPSQPSREYGGPISGRVVSGCQSYEGRWPNIGRRVPVQSPSGGVSADPLPSNGPTEHQSTDEDSSVATPAGSTEPPASLPGSQP